MAPVQVGLLALPKDILHVLAVLNELTHNSNPESVVHCFIEEVPIELDDVWMVLSFV